MHNYYSMKFSDCYPEKDSLTQSPKIEKNNINFYPILSSYKMEENPAYSDLVYTMTVLLMYAKNEVELSDQ